MFEPLSIVENSSDPIIVFDGQGTIGFANSAVETIVGYSPNEVLGKHVAFFVYPNDREIAHECFHKILEAPGCSIEFRQRVVRKTREIRWIAVRLVNCLDNPDVGGIISYFRDISREIALEKALRHAQRGEVLGQLVGQISHDFNNLLMVIRGFGELLALKLPADLQQDLGEMMDASERAVELTRRLLAFSANLPNKPEVVNIHQAAGEVHRLLLQLMSPRVELLVNSSSETGTVYGDRLSLHQLVMNLVLNARDAVADSEHGLISITTANVELTEADLVSESVLPGSYCEIVVRDNGHGIPPEVLPRIFDPYFTTKAPGSGTGLGMAIIKNVVDEMQGLVQIETEVGQGTSFIIRLPRFMAESVEDAKENYEIPQGSGRLLVVDNDEAVLRFLVRGLSAIGYTPLSASDYEGAIAVLEREGDALDLLILDNIIPEEGGQPLSAHAQTSHPQLRVLMMSGTAQEYSEPQPSKEPELPLLEKPFSVRSLALAVQAALGTTN